MINSWILHLKHGKIMDLKLYNGHVRNSKAIWKFSTEKEKGHEQNRMVLTHGHYHPMNTCLSINSVLLCTCVPSLVKRVFSCIIHLNGRYY